MRVPSTLLLTETEVSKLLPLNDCVEIVEEAFRLHKLGKSLQPEMMQIDADLGEFHVKVGGMYYEKLHFCLKANGLFFRNMSGFGIPNVHGLILLSDGTNGCPLAVMASRELMVKRTAAATVLAARLLALRVTETATICGAGLQAKNHLRALKSSRLVSRAFVFARNIEKAKLFCNEMSAELEMEIEPVRDLPQALSESDICVTCTPAREFYIKAKDVPPGLFIAAVGADSPGKQEIDPKLLRESTVVGDILEQGMSVGELQHNIAPGVNPKEVYAELGDIVAGTKIGRSSTDQVIIFDSTGTALQDVAAAVAVYKKAQLQGVGTSFQFIQ